jgi:predicted DNA-binding protein
MKHKTGRTTKVISIRVPIPLYDRINVLACKQVRTINSWCNMTLERECKPRN